MFYRFKLFLDVSIWMHYRKIPKTFKLFFHAVLSLAMTLSFSFWTYGLRLEVDSSTTRAAIGIQFSTRAFLASRYLSRTSVSSNVQIFLIVSKSHIHVCKRQNIFCHFRMFLDGYTCVTHVAINHLKKFQACLKIYKNNEDYANFFALLKICFFEYLRVLNFTTYIR